MSTTATEAPVEAEETAGPTRDEEDKEGLFPAADFDAPGLQLVKIDGEQIDRIALKFSGTVFLDRSDPRDVALMRAMRLGNDITLQVEGKCSKKGYGFSTDREGELDVVVQEHAIKIETVYQPVLEEG
jgi:hypothetical protein